jgi:transposase-like protein
MADWMSRPLERVYPVLFIDAMVVKTRDGQVTNRPIYTAIGVTVDGRRENPPARLHRKVDSPTRDFSEHAFREENGTTSRR